MQPSRDRELGRVVVSLARGAVARAASGLPPPPGLVLHQIADEFGLEAPEVAALVGTSTRFLASEARRRARHALPPNVVPLHPPARPMARGAA